MTMISNDDSDDQGKPADRQRLVRSLSTASTDYSNERGDGDASGTKQLVRVSALPVMDVRFE